jgi:CMP-N-acetylneuraminic acid synthetase
MVEVLGLVPARSGSQGIPNKNLRLLAGRPLLEYVVVAAANSGAISRLVLTTDSEAIADLGRSLGLEVPFLRPPELAYDDTPMLPVMQHAVRHLEAGGWSPRIVVLLQPTAPLRTGVHIRAAVERLEQGGCDSVASVVPLPKHVSPDYVMRVEDGWLVNFLEGGGRVTRRQDARQAYVRDGTVYAMRRDVLMEAGSLYGERCTPLIVDRADSINLDLPADWEAAEAALQARLSTLGKPG